MNSLCCLCRRHQLKTHAPHWQYRMTPDGTLMVTTPAGVTRATRPPGTAPPTARHLVGGGGDGDGDDLPDPNEHPPPF